MRPNFISKKDIDRWNALITSDKLIPASYKVMPAVMEVCYAGCWLCEKLEDAKCTFDLIARIQYTAAQLSFGRDPWEIHQMIYDQYNSGELEFESESEPCQMN